MSQHHVVSRRTHPKLPKPAICFSKLTKIGSFVQFQNIFNRKRSCPHYLIHVGVATIRFLIVFAPASCPPNLISCFQGHFWWCHERQGHLLPLWDPDWLVLSACKSRRRWPGVHWPNYAKHITHLEQRRHGRMKWHREKGRGRGKRWWTCSDVLGTKRGGKVEKEKWMNGKRNCARKGRKSQIKGEKKGFPEGDKWFAL